jgi:hypothetical protein
LFRDLEGPRREPRLIGEGVFGREHILLEPFVHFGRIGQHTLKQRRGDRENFQSVRARNFHRAADLLVGKIDDIFPGDHAQFGAGHADFRHGARCSFKVR